MRLNAAVSIDAIDVRSEDGEVVITHSVLGGAYKIDSTIEGDLGIITVRQGAIKERLPAAQPRLQTLQAAVDADHCAIIDSIGEGTTSSRPDLRGAATVVSGGVASGPRTSFPWFHVSLILWGAAIGASRAAVDAGCIDHSFQVGQTGVTVSPRLYVALGISGATQHRAGMETAKTIVAINKDPKAPIFEVSDFGVVGDVFEIVPQLIEEIEARRGGADPWAQSLLTGSRQS